MPSLWKTGTERTEMTMPKFEPVAKVLVIDEVGRELVFNLQKPLHTADQLTEAYEAGKREASEDLEQAAFEKWLYDKCPSGDVESVQRQWLESYEYAELAGKRDATPEGYALVPKQPTLLMLRAMYPCESTTEAYKAMLAAAPERRRMMTLVELLQQAASESDTPNTSIEGKAANLIERQAAQIEGLNGRFAKDQERIACQSEYLAKQAAQIEMMRDFIETAPVSTGVCCCGESMEGHSSSMNCSHTPVDLWDHSVISVLSTTPDQALEKFAAKVREQCQMTCLEKHANGNWKYDTREECAEAISSIKELP